LERHQKPARSEAEEHQCQKKHVRDHCVRLEHCEQRRLKVGKRLKGITQLCICQLIPVHIELNVEDYPLPVASSGWMGHRQDEPPDPRAYRLDELQETDPEFTVYNWNGCILHQICLHYAHCVSRIPQPVLDREDRVLLVLGGFLPNAADWAKLVTEPTAREMEAAAKEIYTEPKWRRKAAADTANSPRRGPHAAKSVGVSMGGEQRYPMMLHHSVLNAAILAGLFGKKCFERIAGWTNGKPSSSIHVTPDVLIRWPSSVHGFCSVTARLLQRDVGRPL
jgi:hypothetical protein